MISTLAIPPTGPNITPSRKNQGNPFVPQFSAIKAADTPQTKVK